MTKGLIHIYCGDGKGKTTAAVGLAIRCASAGKKVLFAQFLKNGHSSEIHVLKTIEGIQTFHCHTVSGLFSRMSAEQQQIAKKDYSNFFTTLLSYAKDFDVFILDECISASNHGVIDSSQLIDFLIHKPDHLEVVLTGRNPMPELLECADYITEMKKQKHPYDQGIPARKGIEF